MTKTIEDLFIYLVALSDIIFLLLFLIHFKNTKSEKGLWVIAIHCFSDLIVGLIQPYLPHEFVFPLYTFFTLLEYSLFAYFIWLLIKNPAFKKFIIGASIAFTVFLTIYYITTTEFRSVDSLPIGVETILILIYSFYYLFEELNEPGQVFIYDKYPFWVIAGFMLYLGGSFFIYIFANQVDKEVLAQYWTLTFIFLILKNILFSIAILIHVKHKKNPSPEKHLYPYLN
jgi:hypothetical protein